MKKKKEYYTGVLLPPGGGENGSYYLIISAKKGGGETKKGATISIERVRAVKRGEREPDVRVVITYMGGGGGKEK